MVPLGPYGGDVRSLIAHPSQPDIFFLGTADGQIYRSTNRGDQWERLLPGLNRRGLVVDNFAFDPEDPDHLYAATWELRSDKGWLYRTRDGGRTWVNIPLGRYQSSIRALAIAPSDPQVISLGISEGVILSLDKGGDFGTREPCFHQVSGEIIARVWGCPPDSFLGGREGGTLVSRGRQQSHSSPRLREEPMERRQPGFHRVPGEFIGGGLGVSPRYPSWASGKGKTLEKPEGANKATPAQD